MSQIDAEAIDDYVEKTNTIEGMRREVDALSDKNLDLKSNNDSQKNI